MIYLRMKSEAFDQDKATANPPMSIVEYKKQKEAVDLAQATLDGAVAELQKATGVCVNEWICCFVSLFVRNINHPRSRSDQNDLVWGRAFSVIQLVLMLIVTRVGWQIFGPEDASVSCVLLRAVFCLVGQAASNLQASRWWA